MGDAVEEKVVMTPRKKGNVTTIQVERVRQVDSSQVFHEAGGQHKGLVINKDDCQSNSDQNPPEMQLEFTCVMYNIKTSGTHAENRRLKFWFGDGIQQFHRLDSSYEFFKELINPDSFPRDYVGFIKKVMKQLQEGRYERLRRVDVDLITLNKREQDALVPETDERPAELVIRENLQKLLEEAYPNVISMEDLRRMLQVDESTLLSQLEALKDRDLIQQIEMEGKLHGQIGFRRKICHHNEQVHEMKGGNHFQQVSHAEKPTIAIITNLLCEKLAVDAMMEHKTTFVRYKTEGESHVYTIGYIGPHKAISTKLPTVGRDLQSMISSGGTTTRLLGAFQEIEHVLVVGVGGSVPHVYEFEKHSRLGDIVVSAPLVEDEDPAENVYVFCEKVVQPEEDSPPDTPVKFVLKQYSPSDKQMLRCAEKVLDHYKELPEKCQWQTYVQEGLLTLEVQDAEFSRPSTDTDKLKFKIGEGCTFDIKHPEVPEHLTDIYKEGVPAVRQGRIGSGRPVTENDSLRDSFAMEHQLLAFDSEYDQVLESIIGNRVNSYMFIRGIADYVDGSKGTHWQPYASLAAAAFMKAVILEIPKHE